MKFNKKIYSAGNALSLIDRTALRVRHEIYDILCHLVSIDDLSSVLDIGVTADKACLSSNVFENLFPYPERVTALSDQDAQWMEEIYPGMKFISGDARHLTLPDNSFELVCSSAVLEHVGSFENQRQMVSECIRVSNKFIFLTTPNRWHPLEFHTGVPFIHWLPKYCHRYILSLLGHQSLAQEKHLNLLCAKNLKTICADLGIQTYQILSPKFLGFRSNLLLFIDLSMQNKK